ncbi:hypothetical protein Esti_002334 [Eimeria stiedai]
MHASLFLPLTVLLLAALPETLNAYHTARRKHSGNELASGVAAEPLLIWSPKQQSLELPRSEGLWGFVQLFKKLFRRGSDNDEEEVPTTSEQRRGAWREEERHAEFAFCTDVGFRGLHPEEGGEEAACWSRCGRVCESAMFLAEDALPEWRLISVATRTKPCKTLAKKSAVQILCKAVKKPTNFDISSAVKQEMTFDLEAQQQEQTQQLQQQQLLVQQQLALAGAGEAAGLAGGVLAAPETFASAAYGRGRSGFPRWALYLIFAAIGFLCLAMLCCAACCRR